MTDLKFYVSQMFVGDGANKVRVPSPCYHGALDDDGLRTMIAIQADHLRREFHLHPDIPIQLITRLAKF